MVHKKYLFLLLAFVSLQLAHSQQIQKRSTSFAAVFHNTSLCRPEVQSNMDDPAKSEKSGFLAVVYSLLLPGMGELYAGDFSKAKYNLVGDGVLWLTFAGLNLYGGYVRDDGRTFAVQHAGVNLSGKDDQYFVNIGNFLDISEYNQKKLRDRTLSSVYSEDPNAGLLWKWDSDQNRQLFKDTRTFSDELFNGGRFVVLALVANRVWSAIHAAMLVSEYNDSLAPQQSSLPSFQSNVTYYYGRPDGISFSFSQSF